VPVGNPRNPEPIRRALIKLSKQRGWAESIAEACGVQPRSVHRWRQGYTRIPASYHAKLIEMASR